MQDGLRDKLLAGGHKSFEVVSPTAGHNFGRVKQSKSVDSSLEASSMATGHNFSRGEQTFYARNTLETSRLSSGHNSLESISMTAGHNLDGSSSQSQYADDSEQAV